MTKYPCAPGCTYDHHGFHVAACGQPPMTDHPPAPSRPSDVEKKAQSLVAYVLRWKMANYTDEWIIAGVKKELARWFAEPLAPPVTAAPPTLGEEDDMPALYSQGWDACIAAMKTAGVDATAIIAEHTRGVLRKTMEKWEASQRAEPLTAAETPPQETRMDISHDWRWQVPALGCGSPSLRCSRCQVKEGEPGAGWVCPLNESAKPAAVGSVPREAPPAVSLHCKPHPVNSQVCWLGTPMCPESHEDIRREVVIRHLRQRVEHYWAESLQLAERGINGPSDYAAERALFLKAELATVEAAR